MVHTLRQGYALQSCRRPLHPLLGRHAGIDHGQGDILQGIVPWKQVEGLEDEADLAVADIGQLAVLHLAYIHPIEDVMAAAGRVQTAQDVHKCGLARARRAHNCYILVFENRKRDPVQSSHLLISDPVYPVDILESDNPACFLHIVEFY